MALAPLTVYLPRAALVQLERRAAQAGLSRSKFASRAVASALDEPSQSSASLASEIDEIKQIALRLDARFASPADAKGPSQ